MTSDGQGRPIQRQGVQLASLAQPRRVVQFHARCVLFIAGLWIALAAGTVAQTTTTSLPAATVAEMDRTVTAFMTKVQVPGLSLAVGRDGALRFEKGYGFADLEHRVPATPLTVYRLASVSKPITAVAAMQLVDRGRLALDDTVGQWLSHQSGIRHYTTEEDDSAQAYARHYESLRESWLAPPIETMASSEPRNCLALRSSD